MTSLIRKLFGSKFKDCSTTISFREITSKITIVQNYLARDRLHNIPRHVIYDIEKFDFRTAYSIREHKETLSLQNKFEKIKLLSTSTLSKYRDQGFNYLHFGLIQVAIKALA